MKRSNKEEAPLALSVPDMICLIVAYCCDESDMPCENAVVWLAQTGARVCRQWYQTTRQWLDRAAECYKGERLSIRPVRAEWPWQYRFDAFPLCDCLVYRKDEQNYTWCHIPITAHRLRKLSVTQADASKNRWAISKVKALENLRLSAASVFVDGPLAVCTPSTLTQLRTLSLTGTSSYNVKLESLSHWPLLQTLKLCGIGLSGQANATLPALPELRKLALKNVRFSATTLDMMTHLTALTLYRTTTVDARYDSLRELTQLQRLELAHWPLTDETFDPLHQLTELVFAELSTADTITLAAAAQRGSLWRLKQLSLNMDLVDCVVLGSILSALTNLTDLTLSIEADETHAPLTYQTVQSYRLPVSLQRFHLQLEKVPFLPDCLNGLTDLTRLQKLELAIWSVDDDDDDDDDMPPMSLPSLTTLTGLRHLQLRGEIHFPALSQLTTLQSLDTQYWFMSLSKYTEDAVLACLSASGTLNGHSVDCWYRHLLLQEKPCATLNEYLDNPAHCLPTCPQHVLNRLAVSAKNQ
jgi:hypothetical protein